MIFLLSSDLICVCQSEEIEINSEGEGANAEYNPNIFLVIFLLI